jgi:hypothetical protein
MAAIISGWLNGLTGRWIMANRKIRRIDRAKSAHFSAANQSA